jgi:hypothetical protein
MRGMTTQTIDLNADSDTLQVNRPVMNSSPSRRRLSEMDLDPPSGPVPAEVLAYFESALEREGRRRAA